MSYEPIIGTLQKNTADLEAMNRYTNARDYADLVGATNQALQATKWAVAKGYLRHVPRGDLAVMDGLEARLGELSQKSDLLVLDAQVCELSSQKRRVQGMINGYVRSVCAALANGGPGSNKAYQNAVRSELHRLVEIRDEVQEEISNLVY